jgi:LPS export ABC transporter protein LptC
MTSPPSNQPAKKRRIFQGRSLIVWGLVGLIGLAVAGLWWYSIPSPPAPQPVAAPEKKAQMEGLSLTEIEKGDKRWILNASKAEYLRDRNEIRIQDIHLEFYGPDQEVIYVQAQEGLVNTKERDLALKGEVTLKKGDFTIRTPEVRYIAKERALVAPKEIVLMGPRTEISGKGLYIDLAEKRLVLKEHRMTKLMLKKGLL